MTNVKPIHRAKTFFQKYSKQEYLEAVSLFQDTILEKISDRIYSIILCGSLVKDTLTPGWSDIDLVIVVKCESSNIIASSIYQAIAQAIAKVEESYGIPVGIDLITTNELPGESVLPKILARPVNLTYQMMLHSRTLYGEEILSNIQSRNTSFTILEEYLSILSCAHNYRRVCCQGAIGGVNKDYFLATIQSGIKTLFKILESLSDFFDGKLLGYSNLIVNLEDHLPIDICEKARFFVRLIEDFSSLNDLKKEELEQILNNLSTTIDLTVSFSQEVFRDKIKYIVEYLDESLDV